MNKLVEVMQDIQAEMTQIESLRQELDSLRNLSYSGVARAQGSVLHDFYTGCERVFLRIAQDIDRDVPQGERWHVTLLERMEAERGDTRPEVISNDLARMLRPYLGFRHVFRNIYGFELQVERLSPLIEDFNQTLDRFLTELSTFVDFLQEVQNSL